MSGRAVANAGVFIVAVGEGGTVALAYACTTGFTLTQAGTATLRVIAESGKHILLAGDGGALHSSDELPF